MSDKDWKSEHPDNREPWDPDYYETGSTRPPKNHGGLIAVLLVTVIFLGGIASTLGILNFRSLTQLEDPDDVSTSVAVSATSAQDDTFADISLPNTYTTAGSEQSALELATSPLSVENIPQEGGLSLQEIYEQAIDSVVSISCTVSGGTSSGTGVVFSSDGYIVTNAHVVGDALSIQVQLTDEREFTADLVGADEVTDIAVLYIPATDLKAAEFGDSSVLRVGDTVVAIGDPLGSELRGTMTDGIVSAINRDITVDGRTMTLIQTNAALNAGNSGGPLLNCYGQVIGINTMKMGDYMSDAGVEGLGFAIPSTTIRDIVDQLITQGYVSGRPTLGISGESVPVYYQRYFGMPAGLYITQVDDGTDAASAGIAAGDILISIDGTRITDMDTLTSLLYSYQAGDTVNVIIYRAGQQWSLQLTLGEMTS